MNYHFSKRVRAFKIMGGYEAIATFGLKRMTHVTVFVISRPKRL